MVTAAPTQADGTGTAAGVSPTKQKKSKKLLRVERAPADPDVVTRLVEAPARLRRAAAAQTTAADPVVLDGVLLSRDGTPMVGAPVRVDLEPAAARTAKVKAGVALGTVMLASGTTGDGGRFTLRTRPLGDLTGFVDPDGSVSPLVTSFSGRGNLLYHVRAFPPREPAAGWVWADPDTAVAAPGAARTARATGTGSSSEATAGSAPLTGLRFTAQGAAAPRSTNGAAKTADVNESLECDGNYYYWSRYDGAIIKKLTRVQFAKTKDRTKVTYNWSQSKLTTVDAAANLGVKGALVRAGLTKVALTKSGANFKLGHNRFKDMAVEFDYRPWLLTCVQQPGGYEYSSGVYEWRPFKFTGGHDKLKAKTGFKCNPRWAVSITDDLWVARDTSYTYGAGVSYAGVSLRAQQTNSEGYKLTYIASKRAGLCGANAYPSEARRSKEMLPQ